MPHEHGATEEHPLTHKIIIGSIIVFLLVWILDSFIFTLSTQLAVYIPLFYIRIPLCALFIFLSILFSHLTHKAIFKDHIGDDKVIRTGIYAYVRNPMYLMIPLAFIGLTFLTFSLISIIPIVLTFFSYNIFVNYEEKELEKKFGQDYLDYKKKVRRWLPRLTPARFI